ncbi:succinylglutamate-semialdehyde dehydrogenase [Mucisphaera calidilacus]|uniref:N-succinylglutamate 5-semialdehyde dehydrogenase n=1 Tax=Mucisphaera calidilacus TaxID=2527982 RepID=A0A518BXM4_9BACT|nr:succinylglutamate-semialdehyde dehydrogenase [Mucisphaera calidilacus]QDU71708.1 N-succinylglutamate 5-semialdehyde dehydrogenase [Mucisphaera calidilacus]
MTPGQHLINGNWAAGTGAPLQAHNPWSLEPTWQGNAASGDQVDEAVQAARDAHPAWAATPLDQRIEIAQRYAELAKQHTEEIALAIAREAGKPLWEARGEAALLAPKVATSIEEHRRQLADRTIDLPNGRGVTRYRPHGLLAVIGPFNFPIHLPNGHITPALLAGNTIVFKPSERTPTAGMIMAELWQKAGLPQGVLSAVVGARDTGQALVQHPQTDGVLFTGSYPAGRSIAASLVDEPGKIVALELGGNNPIVVHDTNHLDTAAYITAVSAFSTAGQRCNCARRVILTDSIDRDAFLDRLTGIARSITVGPFDAEPAPFCGPLITPQAGQAILDAQQQLLDFGAAPVLPLEVAGPHTGILTPGILAIEPDKRPDEEYFGPLLSVLTTRTLDDAIALANQTRYGLAASLLTDNAEHFDRFVHTVRAGIINLNGPTVGASGKMPFGGIGRSGNHRPSASAAAAYCAFPVASMEAGPLAPVDKPLPGITPSS